MYIELCSQIWVLKKREELVPCGWHRDTNKLEGSSSLTSDSFPVTIAIMREGLTFGDETVSHKLWLISEHSCPGIDTYTTTRDHSYDIPTTKAGCLYFTTLTLGDIWWGAIFYPSSAFFFFWSEEGSTSKCFTTAPDMSQCVFWWQYINEMI